jgi:aspartate kinase
LIVRTPIYRAKCNNTFPTWDTLGAMDGKARSARSIGMRTINRCLLFSNRNITIMDSDVHVLKFGGTSVGSGERIRRVASIIAHWIEETPEAWPVVVVSAMSGITDQLLRIARYASNEDDEECERELQELGQRHLDAVEEAVRDAILQQTVRRELSEALRGLKGDVAKLCKARTGSSKRMQMDLALALRTAAIAAWGERLSIRLVAAALRDQGMQAEFVCEEVIITEPPRVETAYEPGTVSGTEPLAAQTQAQAHKLIMPLVQRRIVPVAPGFIGRTLDGDATTLGRNGSDYSATVIGAALDCVEVTIYTDVDGVLTTDPRLVSNARLLPQLSYAEAARLSWFGAKVLHPRTLIPVAPRNIPVRVRNSFRPHIRGTVVGPVVSEQSGATAITIRRHLALITMESTDMFGAPENAAQVFALAARAGAAPVAICSSSGHHLSFLVEEKSAASVIALLQHDMGTWTVRARKELTACACIGSGFTTDPMSSSRAKAALAQERIPVITEGASEQGIMFIVADRDGERALRSLHRHLIAPVIPLVRHRTAQRTGERDRDEGQLRLYTRRD